LNDFQIAEIQLLASSYQVDKLIDENLKINFEYINLELQKDKLVIKGLQYDKKLVSQAQLANQLNTVMEKIIMPKLREIKQEADTQKSNIASHKE
jgi:NurA-like 5'-3' nuclease